MTKIKVDLTSIITQNKETETFHQHACGEFKEGADVIRVSYRENQTIPVNLLLKENELILRRGVDHANYSLLRFVPGEKAPCRYLVSGRQMDLTSVTNYLAYSDLPDGSSKLRLEYDLFSGLYLVGNYAVTLIFT